MFEKQQCPNRLVVVLITTALGSNPAHAIYALFLRILIFYLSLNT